MFGSLGLPEILVIILIGGLLFGGGKKLAQLGKGLGEGIVNFKSSLQKGSEKTDNENSSENAKNDE